MSTTPTTSTTPQKTETPTTKKRYRPGIAHAARMQARITELEAKVQELEGRELSDADSLRLSALSLMERDIRALLPEKEREGHLPDLVGKRFSALSALASNINQADLRTRQRFGFMPEALNLKQIIDKWESAFQAEYDRAEREIQKAEASRREVVAKEATIEGLRAQLKALDQKGQAIRDALPPDTQELSLEEAVTVTLERLSVDIQQQGAELRGAKTARDDFHLRNGELQRQLEDAKAEVVQLTESSQHWYDQCNIITKKSDRWLYWFVGTSGVGAILGLLRLFGVLK